MRKIKLVKQKYYGKNGEQKVCCFHINLAKSVLKEAGLDKQEYINIEVKDNKIIISKGE